MLPEPNIPDVAIGSAIEPHFVSVFLNPSLWGTCVAIGSAIEPHFVEKPLREFFGVLVAIGSAIEPHFVALYGGMAGSYWGRNWLCNLSLIHISEPTRPY